MRATAEVTVGVNYCVNVIKWRTSGVVVLINSGRTNDSFNCKAAVVYIQVENVISSFV